MNHQLVWLGQWADSETHNRPRPNDHIDSSWDEHERILVASHLEGGFWIGAPLDGDGVCLLCGERMYRGFVRTDGTFIWRDGLAHYVREHSVRLPQRFINHVLELCDRVEVLDDDDWQWWDGDPYAADPGKG